MNGSTAPEPSRTGSFAFLAALAVAPGASPPSASPPAAVAQDTSTQVYEVGGVRVIHRRTTANQLLAVDLYLLGGSRQLTERTAGIEPLLLHASERGTRGFPGPATLEAEVRTGSRIVISAGPDWTLFGFRGLATEFESTWAVFADRLMHPELDSAGVEIARARMLTSRRATADDPEAVASGMAQGAAFTGHPYALAANGTERSLTGITVADLRSYHAEQIHTSRLLLAVVGDMSRDRIEAAIAATLATLPRGDFTWEPPRTWAADRPTVRTRHRELPTNYIVGYFGGPEASSDEYPAFRIALALLSGLVFQEVRSQGLSYAAGVTEVARAASGGVVHVSTAYPEASMEIVNEAIRLLGGVVLRRSMLRDYAKGWITGYWLDSETNAEQASFLARAYLFRAEPRTPEEFVEELRSVGPDAVRRVTNRYIKHIQYAFVGDTTMVPHDALKKH